MRYPVCPRECGKCKYLRWGSECKKPETEGCPKDREERILLALAIIVPFVIGYLLHQIYGV